MPVTASIALGAAKGLAPIAGGIMQNIQARKLNRKNKRPIYNVDAGYQQNIDEAAALAKGRTRQFQNAEMQADQAMANSAELAKGFSGNNTATSIGSLIASQNQRNEAQRAILGAESAFQANATQNLAAQRQAMAEERDKAFNYNLNMPYQNTREEAINLRNSGNALIGQGFQSLGDSAENLIPLMGGMPMKAKKGIKRVKVKK
jgi:hypothetical protein